MFTYCHMSHCNVFSLFLFMSWAQRPEASLGPMPWPMGVLVNHCMCMWGPAMGWPMSCHDMSWQCCKALRKRGQLQNAAFDYGCCHTCRLGVTVTYTSFMAYWVYFDMLLSHMADMSLNVCCVHDWWCLEKAPNDIWRLFEGYLKGHLNVIWKLFECYLKAIQ